MDKAMLVPHMLMSTKFHRPPHISNFVLTTQIQNLSMINISWFTYMYNTFSRLQPTNTYNFPCFHLFHNISHKVFHLSSEIFTLYDNGHPPNVETIFIQWKKISSIRCWFPKGPFCCLRWGEWEEKVYNSSIILELLIVSRTANSGWRRIRIQSSDGWPNHSL